MIVVYHRASQSKSQSGQSPVLHLPESQHRVRVLYVTNRKTRNLKLMSADYSVDAEKREGLRAQTPSSTREKANCTFDHSSVECFLKATDVLV